MGGSSPPAFLHHPLLLRPSGDKLSKAAGDTGLRDLRRGGASPEAVLGEAAFRVGLTPTGRPISAADLGGLFAPQASA